MRNLVWRLPYVTDCPGLKGGTGCSFPYDREAGCMRWVLGVFKKKEAGRSTEFPDTFANNAAGEADFAVVVLSLLRQGPILRA